VQIVGFAILAVLALAVVYVFLFRPWHRRWGATDQEVAGRMPGDEMVPGANLQATRAITIQAPPEAVWPWLVQLGQGRGGFYSYDLLENMMGLDIQSAIRIRPELQGLQEGDRISLEPGGGGYAVAELEPNRHLVLFTEGAGESELDEVFRKANAASTWTFLLEALDDGECTRLCVRWRARWDLLSSPMSFLIGVMLDPIEFVMERKMLRGIKQRAEAVGQ
jgi:hypothetical protein